MDKRDREKVLKALSDIADVRFQEDDIEHAGTKLILPLGMDEATAITMLQRHMEAQNARFDFSQRYEYRWQDGFVALKRVLRELTGFDPVQNKMSFFGMDFTPPTLRIATGHEQWEEVPTGEFPLDFINAQCTPSMWMHEEKGKLFELQVNAPRRFGAQVDAVFKMVQAQLEERSIYRGQAITAEDDPTFLDLRNVDENQVIYSQDVLTQLNANVWSLIEHTEAMRENNLPLKRAVLFSGPYGTGKTLGAYLTAKKASDNGWTFLFVRPGKDSLTQALATAKLYQPAVVFFEDVDTTSNPETDVSYLLDVFDGIQAKGTEVIAIFTTNHVERLHKGLMRPGRLDAVITIGALDPPGIEALIRALVPAESLPDELDMDAIAAAMDGFMPAYIREAVDRTVRYSVARNDGRIGELTSQDFVDAGNGLRPQLDLMEGAAENFARPPIDEALRSLVTDEIITKAVVARSGDQLPIVEKEVSV